MDNPPRTLATGHVVERINKKGVSFIGVCILCGAENLTIRDMGRRCENKRGLSEEEALQLIVKGPKQHAKVEEIRNA